MMDPVTIATTLGLLLLTKATESAGEKLGEELVNKAGEAIAFIYRHAPEVAKKIQAGNKEVLKDPAVAKIPLEPILGELVVAADAEPNEVFQKNLPDVKAGKIVQVLIENFYQTNTTNIYQAPAPPKYSPTYSYPPASANFVGRDGVLERLAGLHTSREIVAVVGMAGVGKTELAAQYARKYGRNYTGGCYWLGMIDRNLANVLQRQIKIEFKLDLPPEITNKSEIAQWCWGEWARNLPADSQVLVVLDNVDEAAQIGGMLPGNSCFRLLVTTRAQSLVDANAEENLVELTPPDALKLLEKLVGSRVQQEIRAAQELCHELLGDLPLGIELVGRYLQRDKEISIAGFIKNLAAVQEALDKEDLVATYGTMTAQRGVQSALELSWQKLDWESQTVAKLLGLCAPKPIPWEVVRKMAERRELEAVSGEKTTCARRVRQQLAKRWKQATKRAEINQVEVPARFTVEDVRRELDNLHLIKWDENRKTATLHALVREFFHQKAQLPDDSLKQIFADTMLQRAHQAGQDMVLERVAEMDAIIPHIKEVASHYTHLLSDDDLVWPFLGIGRFYDSQGLYASAEPWYEMCLEKAEQRLGANHPSTATSLNNLAGLYESIGKYAAAEPLYVRALDIRERQLGADHPDTASSLNNLAGLYRSIGKYAAAEPLYVRALDIKERQLGADHPSTATSLNNLAGLYESIGKYAAAEPLYVRALDIRERQLGANHPSTASSLNNLAALYRSIDRSEEALPLYARAVEICEHALGLEHPTTVTIRGNYERCLGSQTDA